MATICSHVNSYGKPVLGGASPFELAGGVLPECIVRDVETLECRMAPLFDSGSSLWCDLPTAALAAGERSFSSKQFFESPAKQMLLVEDLGWIDTEALRGFVDEAREILSRNDALGERLPHILRALEWRVARMCNIAAWA